MNVIQKVMTSKTILNSNENPDKDGQEYRDRAIRGNRKKSDEKYRRIKFTHLVKIKLTKYIINDLENYGPAGILHMDPLSNVIGRPIRIWKSSHLYRTINSDTSKCRNQHPVDVQYHVQTQSHNGHWTLLGNKDPINAKTNLNSCLFTVIADQINRNTDDLRTNVIHFIVKNKEHFNKQIDELLFSNDNNKSLMTGGARYAGTSPQNAAIILDNSQNVLCHGCRECGHPRGHASDGNATGEKDSVENYSLSSGSMKSGFLSRTDQNRVAHTALCHVKAQQAMQKLNTGEWSQSITFTRQDLQSQNSPLPKMQEYYNGRKYGEELDIIRVTLVLRHHQNKINDPNADVFVHTFYPRCS